MLTAAESYALDSIVSEARGMDSAVAMLDGLGLPWPAWYAVYVALDAVYCR